MMEFFFKGLFAFEDKFAVAYGAYESAAEHIHPIAFNQIKIRQNKICIHPFIYLAITVFHIKLVKSSERHYVKGTGDVNSFL